MLVLCEIFKCYFVVVYTKVVCKVQGLHAIQHWKNYKVRYDFIVFKKVDYKMAFISQELVVVVLEEVACENGDGLDAPWAFVA